MSKSSEPTILECEDCIEPAEAFAVVGNETRLSILEALWGADERPVAFSDLRSAVGMRDSAQFNYHLKELRGQFVTKVDGGYELRHAGEKVVQAVLAGSFNEDPRLAPFEVQGECHDCGASLQASYADEQLGVVCTECGTSHGRYSFPPGGLSDRTREEVMRAFDQRVQHLHCLAADGVCPECNGRMETTIEGGGDCCLGTDLRAEHVCQRCDHERCSPIGLALLDHSAVVGFHQDHGITLSDRPYWTLPWIVSEEYLTVESEDPWRITVRMPADEEALRVTVDGDLQVVGAERVRDVA